MIRGRGILFFFFTGFSPTAADLGCWPTLGCWRGCRDAAERDATAARGVTVVASPFFLFFFLDFLSFFFVSFRWLLLLLLLLLLMLFLSAPRVSLLPSTLRNHCNRCGD